LATGGGDGDWVFHKGDEIYTADRFGWPACLPLGVTDITRHGTRLSRLRPLARDVARRALRLVLAAHHCLSDPKPA
jgi:hypothetical protein